MSESKSDKEIPPVNKGEVSRSEMHQQKNNSRGKSGTAVICDYEVRN